jgi:hypothetical protein
MINNKRISTFAHIVFILFLLSGCENSIESKTTEAIIDSAGIKTATSNQPTPLSEQIDEKSTPQATIENTTPTPDLRIPAEQWKDWPIIPEVTNNAIDIYARGIQTKVNSRSFSKIGDCQNKIGKKPSIISKVILIKMVWLSNRD